jgi:hypothetical protein
MTAFEQACDVYQREDCERDFHEDFFTHLQLGIVVSTPEAFVMLRPVMRCWTIEMLLDPNHVANVATADTWWVWLAAGDQGLAWRMAEAAVRSMGIDPLKIWLAFQKRNRPRFHRITRMRQLVCHSSTTQTTQEDPRSNGT